MLPTQHVSWGSISLLHNVVRTHQVIQQTHGTPPPVVTYRAKVKLHGSNVGIQITPHGVIAQSRSKLLTPDDDYKGFARWLAAHADAFAALPHGIIIFGEWCGPGIEAGVAISQIPEKILAVFAIQEGRDEAARYIVEPDVIRARLAGMPVHVLPWEGAPFTLDLGDEAALEVQAEQLSARVEAVEAADPFVQQTFGVVGVGEGLVLYPQGITTPEPLFRLMFKAKGAAHRTAGRAPARPKAEAASGVEDFIALVVTEARLAQGLSAVCDGQAHMRHTGAFLRWIVADTRSESVDELEAAGLTWEQVQRPIEAHARDWLRSRCS